MAAMCPTCGKPLVMTHSHGSTEVPAKTPPMPKPKKGSY